MIKIDLKNPGVKRIVYFVCALAVFVWLVFRIAVLISESRREVFNASRMMDENGVPVTVMNVVKKSGVLYEPIAIKNGRGYVSGMRAARLKAGQKIGDGRIVSVSSSIDFDTGMHPVSTTGVSDGLHYAQFYANGIFVPLDAINDGMVMVAQDGVAVSRPVTILRQDSENALIGSGLSQGDVVILTGVNSGKRISVKKVEE